MENLLGATALIGVWLWFLFKLSFYWVVALLALEAIPRLFLKAIYDRNLISDLVLVESRKLNFGDQMPEICFLDIGQIPGGGVNKISGGGIVFLPVPTSEDIIRHEVYHAYRGAVLRCMYFTIGSNCQTFLITITRLIIYLLIEEPLAALYALFGVDFSLKRLLFRFKKSRGAS